MAEPGAVLGALEQTLDSLRDLGRLNGVDEAVVALCRSTAQAVDDAPGRAALVKEYRECLVLLYALGASGDDGLKELMAELAGTPLRDTPPS